MIQKFPPICIALDKQSIFINNLLMINIGITFLNYIYLTILAKFNLLKKK